MVYGVRCTAYSVAANPQSMTHGPGGRDIPLVPSGGRAGVVRRGGKAQHLAGRVEPPHPAQSPQAREPRHFERALLETTLTARGARVAPRREAPLPECTGRAFRAKLARRLCTCSLRSGTSGSSAPLRASYKSVYLPWSYMYVYVYLYIYIYI